MHRRFFAAYFAAQRTMATDENNHKNEARDDWTGCTFRVERGPSSEGPATWKPNPKRKTRTQSSDTARRPIAAKPLKKKRERRKPEPYVAEPARFPRKERKPPPEDPRIGEQEYSKSTQEKNREQYLDHMDDIINQTKAGEDFINNWGVLSTYKGKRGEQNHSPRCRRAGARCARRATAIPSSLCVENNHYFRSSTPSSRRGHGDHRRRSTRARRRDRPTRPSRPRRSRGRRPERCISRPSGPAWRSCADSCRGASPLTGARRSARRRAWARVAASLCRGVRA